MSDDLATLAQQIGHLQSAVVSGINEVALLRRQIGLVGTVRGTVKGR